MLCTGGHTNLTAIVSAVLVIPQWVLVWVAKITDFIWKIGTIIWFLFFFPISAFFPCLVSSRIASSVAPASYCTNLSLLNLFGVEGRWVSRCQISSEPAQHLLAHRARLLGSAQHPRINNLFPYSWGSCTSPYLIASSTSGLMGGGVHFILGAEQNEALGTPCMGASVNSNTGGCIHCMSCIAAWAQVFQSGNLLLHQPSNSNYSPLS